MHKNVIHKKRLNDVYFVVFPRSHLSQRLANNWTQKRHGRMYASLTWICTSQLSQTRRHITRSVCPCPWPCTWRDTVTRRRSARQRRSCWKWAISSKSKTIFWTALEIRKWPARLVLTSRRESAPGWRSSLCSGPPAHRKWSWASATGNTTPRVWVVLSSCMKTSRYQTRTPFTRRSRITWSRHTSSKRPGVFRTRSFSASWTRSTGETHKHTRQCNACLLISNPTSNERYYSSHFINYVFGHLVKKIFILYRYSNG